MDVGHQRFNPKELLDYIGLDSRHTKAVHETSAMLSHRGLQSPDDGP